MASWCKSCPWLLLPCMLPMLVVAGTIEQYPSEDEESMFDFFLDPVTVSGLSTPVGPAARWWLMFRNKADREKLQPGEALCLVFGLCLSFWFQPSHSLQVAGYCMTKRQHRHRLV